MFSVFEVLGCISKKKDDKSVFARIKFLWMKLI